MNEAAPAMGAPAEGGHPLAVSRESFASLMPLGANPALRLRWRCPFVGPRWVEAWWRSFGSGEPILFALRRGEAVVGVAPLMVAGDTAQIIGDREVTDHLDIVTAPGATGAVLASLRRELRRMGIRALDLMRIRPDSTAAAELVPAARALGLAVDFAPQDAGMELALPGSWETYLQMLSGKQRHELRRKMRRLERTGAARLRLAQSAAEKDAAVASFLRLFRLNRPEKARFMTPQMERYFSALAAGLDADGALRMHSLEVDGETAAVAFCFQHAQMMYLYNNAYDERFSALSVGILSKALSIRESIRAGLRGYDFLRGDEAYKHHLGARPVALYSCRIDLG
jgi:CelD/BcsL family acetyltransferase involved in cellulose biosynthesis